MISRTPSYEMRPATVKDSAFICKIRSLTMGPYLPGVTGWTPEKQEECLMDFDPESLQIILVDRQPTGAIAVEQHPTHRHVAGMYLLPLAREAGLGTHLIGLTMQQAHRDGLTVTGCIHKADDESLEIWRGSGSHICGESGDRYLLACPPPKNRWLAHYKPNAGAKVRLFCFSYSGGNASLYRGWAEALPSFIEVMPIQLPGHGTRISEPLVKSMDVLVNVMAQAVLGYLDKPYALFGHSTGALIAFELARRLRAECAYQPCHLFASGCGAPQLQPDRPGRIHDAPDADFFKAVCDIAGSPDAIPADPELCELVTPILRADFELTEMYRYVCGEPLPCPITAFGGQDDRFVTATQLQGWSVQTASAFSFQRLPGSHMFLVNRSDPVRRCVAEELSRVRGNAVAVAITGPLSNSRDNI